MEKTGKTSDKEATGCPEHEVICAYFDGELDMGCHDAAHIRSCPRCQAIISDFERMAEVLGRKAESAPSDDFPERMLERVRAKISEEKNRIIPFYMVQLMKAAAIFILIAGIFIYVKNTTDVKPLVAVTEPIRSSPPAKIISASPDVRTIGKGGIAGEIQLKDMQDVSTSPDIRFMGMMPQKEDTANLPAAIPGSVTHVWTTGNIEKAMADARGCLIRSGVDADRIRFRSDSSGTSSLSMEMNKKQLSSFVKGFSRDGYQLLSPVQPQPEQNLFYGSAEDPVAYEFRIVPNSR